MNDARADQPATGADEAARGRIVVGIDGSVTARAALRWAAEEASLRNLGVYVAICWQLPVMLGIYSQPLLEATDLEGKARELAESEVDEVFGVDRRGLDVSLGVLEGAPALRLLELGELAEMIVVGTRGHGGFAGLLLGSVSQHVAEHARCPVVIIPHRQAN